MTPPRVSVVIPTYNHAELLRQALTSVVAQTMGDWECLVVNNHSTDNTQQVVDSFADLRIRLINFQNQGVIAASRNVGIEQARGDWVAFLDSDDLWSADKLEECLRVSGPDTAVVSHPELFVRDDIVVHSTQVATSERVSYKNLLFMGNCLSPSAILVRRLLLQRLGGFCTDAQIVTAEDYDLWLRIAQTAPNFAFVDKHLATYRLHDGQNSGRILKHRDASLEVLRRHLASMPWWKRFLGRCPQALAVYAAGRSFQKAGHIRQALGQWLWAGALWPLFPFVLIIRQSKSQRPKR